MSRTMLGPALFSIPVACALTWATFALSPGEDSLPAVEAFVDRNQAYVADPITLTVTLTAESGNLVVFPERPNTLGTFDVVSTHDQFDVPVQQGRTWTRILQLEAYEVGEFEIPSLQIEVDGALLKTKPIPIIISSVLADDENPRAFRVMKDPAEVQLQQDLPYRSWYVAGGGIILLTALTVWLLRRKRKIVTPTMWALAKLEALERAASSDSHDQLLPLVADIMREYLGRQFGVWATRQTTPEFLSNIRVNPRLNPQQQQMLESLLSAADKIKFAAGTPQSSQTSEILVGARRFVMETTETVDDAKDLPDGGNVSQLGEAI